jgi:predicted dehydrogenase
MKVLVVGAGMYVTGRNNSGTGTILSSLAELSRKIDFGKITIASKSESSRESVDSATERINRILQTQIDIGFTALGEKPLERLSALCRNEKYDLAIISVPDHLHFENARVILENNIHCLLVKPLTPTAREARELIEIQKAKKLYAAVEFHKRYDQTNLYIKKALNEKKLGKLLYFTVDYSQRIDIPLKTFSGWADKTNIFQYLGVHYVDLIYFLTGFIPIRVSAYGTCGILKKEGINTYDSVHAQIIWKDPDGGDEFISSFNTNWIDPSVTSALSDQKYKVIGTLGRIECDQKNRGVELVTEKTGVQQINPYFADYFPNESGGMNFSGYGYTSIEHFVQDVQALTQKRTTMEKLEKTRPTFSNSLVSTVVVENVNESLKKDAQWINIPIQ